MTNQTFEYMIAHEKTIQLQLQNDAELNVLSMTFRFLLIVIFLFGIYSVYELIEERKKAELMRKSDERNIYTRAQRFEGQIA